MTDPFSIAAGAVGLVSLGIQITHTLVGIYNSYEGRDANIKSIIRKLEVLVGTLQTLETALQNRTFAPNEQRLINQIETSIQECEDPIHELREECTKLERSLPASTWTLVKTAGRRLAYPLRESTLKRLNEDIEETRQNLLVALSVLQVHDGTAIQDEIAEAKMLIDHVRDAQISAEIREWLRAPDMVAIHHATCPVFRNWLTSESNSFLWVKGFAGCGKSVLCSTAIQHAFRRTQGQGNDRVGIAFFYFAFSDDSKRDESALLRCLLFQLASQLREGQSILACLQGANKSGPPPASILFDYVGDVMHHFEEVYIFMDALDESQRYGERGKVLETITNLRESAFSKLHLLATSRDELDINEALCASATQTVTMNNTGVDEDIIRFITDQLETNIRLRAKWYSQRERICAALAQRAKGVFRWVECQFAALERCPRSLYHLDQCLRFLPRNLDETYERMLCNIDNKFANEARRILTLLCFSSRPMTVPEVLHALAVDLEEPASFNKQKLLAGVDDLQEICPGLLAFGIGEIHRPGDRSDKVAETTVHIAHFSVQEYLESGRIKKQRVSQFALSCETAHEEIALVCCIYLLGDSLVEGALDQSKLEEYPFAHFAARFWHHHFKRSRSRNPRLTSLISTLFSRRDIFEKLLQVQGFPNEPLRRWGDAPQNVADQLHHASFLGLEWVLQDLINAARGANTDVAAMINNSAGCFGNALHAACAGDNLEAAIMLIRNGADVNISCGGIYGNALQTASAEGHFDMAKMLIEEGARINVPGERFGNALEAAAHGGHTETAEMLIQLGADFECPGRYGGALQAASPSGHIKTAEMLLQNGADIDSKGGHHSTALQSSIATGNIKMAEFLVERGADVNNEGGDYGYALQAAAARGFIEIARILVGKGADVNAQGGFYGNALQAAAAGGFVEMTEFLVEKGADVKAHGRHYGDALQAAVAKGSVETAKVLLANGARIDSKYRVALQAASFLGHLDMAKLLITEGIDVGYHFFHTPFFLNPHPHFSPSTPPFFSLYTPPFSPSTPPNQPIRGLDSPVR